ncbi:MAG: cell division protein, partial [Cyclobacteriaceae bacterium]
MNIKKSIILRVRLAFLAVTLLGIAIVLKMGKIQFVEGSKWVALAEDIGLDYQVVKAARGNIYSDNGSLMATSLPFYRVAMDPSVVNSDTFKEGLDSLATKLSNYFRDRDRKTYKRILSDARSAGKKYIILNKQRINYQDKKMMAGWPIFREGRMRGGIIFEKVNKRFYPFSNLGTRTIGFINENDNGAGLEFSFNQYLAGSDGQALYQKISGGGWKPVYDGTEVRAQEGFDIETTIDINLQDVAETALLRALENHDADYGSVVVMEV